MQKSNLSFGDRAEILDLVKRFLKLQMEIRVNLNKIRCRRRQNQWTTRQGWWLAHVPLAILVLTCFWLYMWLKELMGNFPLNLRPSPKQRNCSITLPLTGRMYSPFIRRSNLSWNLESLPSSSSSAAYHIKFVVLTTTLFRKRTNFHFKTALEAPPRCPLSIPLSTPDLLSVFLLSKPTSKILTRKSWRHPFHL